MAQMWKAGTSSIWNQRTVNDVMVSGLCPQENVQGGEGCNRALAQRHCPLCKTSSVPALSKLKDLLQWLRWLSWWDAGRWDVPFLHSSAVSAYCFFQDEGKNEPWDWERAVEEHWFPCRPSHWELFFIKREQKRFKFTLFPLLDSHSQQKWMYRKSI